MSSTANQGQAGGGSPGQSPRFRPSPDVVYNRIGDQGVLIHMKTNRIYELNRTAARLWELLSDGRDRTEIQRLMLQEFEVADDQLAREVEDRLASLRDERLIEPADAS